MISWRQLFCLSSFLAVAGGALAATPDEESLLAAIRIVETGDNHRSVGRAGERGAYQFRAGTWRQHTREPFHLAHTRYADVVARRHLHWLSAQLQAAQLPSDPYHIALAWNAGLGRVKGGRVSSASRDYAARVQNLANALHEDRLARLASHR